ncbi:sugar ABC transporter substrate-bindnig protein [Candidatus Halobonum tyrrellensis G22]|uniref:Sugar ABC transporter substrate-bindnig protein n=2 Tax=Candidatus Halobonum TaxID=1431544 RepID=V4J1R9_9EURY|nr:sugar ABC transporter substrate-bindnig protein [Candidatus Halobonum tyrrellensis G22]
MGGGGGGGGGGGDGNIELDYWTLFGGGDGEVMKSIIDKFNDEQPLGDNISINRQRTPWEEHYNRLFTSMTGGDPPDMAISHASYLRRFQDTLVDIQDNVSSNDYVDSILSACQIDDGQYAVPMDSHPVGLYYNVDVLNEAGVEPPIESYSQFEEACNAILENTDALPFSPDPYWGGGGGFRQWFMGLNQYGGSMFNDDLTEATFGDEAGTGSLEFLASVSGERGWDQPDISEDRVAQSFRNGSVAMTVNGTWYVNVMREQEFEWGFDKPRVFPEADQLRSTADSHTIVIPQQSNASDERVQAAVDAAEWITQENPSWGAEAGHLPAYNPILNSDELQNADIWGKTLESFMEMANDEQLAYWPQLPNSDLYAGTNWTWVTDAYSQNSEPQAAIEQGVETWNSNLG